MWPQFWVLVPLIHTYYLLTERQTENCSLSHIHNDQQSHQRITIAQSWPTVPIVSQCRCFSQVAAAMRLRNSPLYYDQLGPASQSRATLGKISLGCCYTYDNNSRFLRDMIMHG